MYPSLPPQEPARYVSQPAPSDSYRNEPHYAQPPSAQSSWHAAPPPQQQQHAAPTPDPQPRYQSPERQFQPYASYAAPTAAPASMVPSAPMASPSRETAGFIASAPPESPALSHASAQPPFADAGAWHSQPPAAVAPEPSAHYAPPHPQPSAPAPSAPGAPPARVYNETSFPSAPSANPWDEEPPELEQRQVEAPLIEF